jgi:hypothetical protein
MFRPLKAALRLSTYSLTGLQVLPFSFVPTTTMTTSRPQQEESSRQNSVAGEAAPLSATGGGPPRAKALTGRTKWRGLIRAAQELVIHTLVMLLCLASISVIHFAAVLVLGHDFKLWDLIPLRYVTDTGDFFILLAFIVDVVIRLFRSFRE